MQQNINFLLIDKDGETEHTVYIIGNGQSSLASVLI